MKGLEKRVIYYNAKMITEQINDGELYAQINPVINIIITNQRFIKDSEDYHHHFTFSDLEKSIIFSDVTEAHTLELPKLPTSPDTLKSHRTTVTVRHTKLVSNK